LLEGMAGTGFQDPYATTSTLERENLTDKNHFPPPTKGTFGSKKRKNVGKRGIQTVGGISEGESGNGKSKSSSSINLEIDT